MLDWILALVMLWNSLGTAADEQAKADRLKRELAAQEEAVLYQERSASVPTEATAILPEATYPGDVVLVRSTGPIEFAWQGKTYNLQPFGAGYYSFVPIPIQLKPGSYSIGGKTLTVMPKSFEEDRLTVTAEQEQMQYNTERINADQKKIDAARSRSEPKFLFRKPFIVPVQGRLTTPFGYTRYVNGKLNSSHTAIDLAAPTGTVVKATNKGKVVLAEELYLTGNSIYIDHGMQLFSQYAHLSKILVKAGEEVDVGDSIGLVGSTGFSTGPHLHFTFWAHNVPVNPNLFFQTTPFGWSQKQQSK